jgi:hypothetical protein
MVSTVETRSHVLCAACTVPGRWQSDNFQCLSKRNILCPSQHPRDYRKDLATSSKQQDQQSQTSLPDFVWQQLVAMTAILAKQRCDSEENVAVSWTVRHKMN